MPRTGRPRRPPTETAKQAVAELERYGVNPWPTEEGGVAMTVPDVNIIVRRLRRRKKEKADDAC